MYLGAGTLRRYVASLYIEKSVLSKRFCAFPFQTGKNGVCVMDMFKGPYKGTYKDELGRVLIECGRQPLVVEA